jgi:hypothetical protein
MVNKMQRLSSNSDYTVFARQQMDRQRAEDAWPGDRIPAPSDAEMAYQPLDPRQVAVFKQAMLADVQTRDQRQFLGLENARSLLQQATSADDVSQISRHILARFVDDSLSIALLAVKFLLCLIAAGTDGRIR